MILFLIVPLQIEARRTTPVVQRLENWKRNHNSHPGDVTSGRNNQKMQTNTHMPRNNKDQSKPRCMSVEGPKPYGSKITGCIHSKITWGRQSQIANNQTISLKLINTWKFSTQPIDQSASNKTSWNKSIRQKQNLLHHRSSKTIHQPPFHQLHFNTKPHLTRSKNTSWRAKK
jgi:hypothetical protein